MFVFNMGGHTFQNCSYYEMYTCVMNYRCVLAKRKSAVNKTELYHELTTAVKNLNNNEVNDKQRVTFCLEIIGKQIGRSKTPS